MKKRLHYIDILNCIAIFFVLVMHSAQLAHFGTNKDSNFIATNILQSVCIPAVYIFFMNSGATLLNYRKP
jgi:surface polysaccharide O-acyltransferase-like enzyme